MRRPFTLGMNISFVMQFITASRGHINSLYRADLATIQDLVWISICQVLYSAVAKVSAIPAVYMTSACSVRI